MEKSTIRLFKRATARRMAREYDKQIKEQDLECRRLALEGNRHVVEHVFDGGGGWGILDTQTGRLYDAWRTQEQAVYMAERMNAKKGGAK